MDFIFKRTKPKLLKMFPDGSAKPKMYQVSSKIQFFKDTLIHFLKTLCVLEIFIAY